MEEEGRRVVVDVDLEAFFEGSVRNLNFTNRPVRDPHAGGVAGAAGVTRPPYADPYGAGAQSRR